MGPVGRWLERAEWLFSRLAALALFLMMLSISADAIGRYLFDSPFQGNYEITGLYLMVIVTFLMLSPNHRDGSHVRIDFLAGYFERRWGGRYRRLVAALALVAFLPFTAYATIEGGEKILALETSLGAINYPLYLSYVWLPVGAAVLVLRLALDVVRPGDAGRPPPPGAAE